MNFCVHIGNTTGAFRFEQGKLLTNIHDTGMRAAKFDAFHNPSPNPNLKIEIHFHFQIQIKSNISTSLQYSILTSTPRHAKKSQENSLPVLSRRLLAGEAPGSAASMSERVHPLVYVTCHCHYHWVSDACRYWKGIFALFRALGVVPRTWGWDTGKFCRRWALGGSVCWCIGDRDWVHIVIWMMG